MDITKKLRKIGFSENEALIYEYLLDNGGAYPSKIAETTRINRTTVYHTLDAMAIKGLVTELEKRKKFFYQPESPENVLRYAKSNITLAKRKLENAEQVMPDLRQLFAALPHKPIIRFFEGQKGVLEVYRDHISSNTSYEMTGFSNTAGLVRFLSEKFLRNYIKRKSKLNITSRGILPDTEKDKNYRNVFYKHVRNNIWPQIKFMPAKNFPYHGELTLYRDDRVSIIKFTKENPMGIIIEDKTIYGMMKMMFEATWKSLE